MARPGLMRPAQTAPSWSTRRYWTPTGLRPRLPRAVASLATAITALSALPAPASPERRRYNSDRKWRGASIRPAPRLLHGHGGEPAPLARRAVRPKADSL